jgi:hypothetical protein
MRQSLFPRFALCVGIAAALSTAAAAQLLDPPRPHDSGLTVTPSFEGWFPNADGTFTLSFGYMNRNRKEALDIPVGPNNRLEPGPTDQGQPTHFDVRRHTGVFTVVVPKDFGDRKLTWSITTHGETISIPGHLRPEWMIDALKEITSGNTPPVVRFDRAGKGAQGPGGTTTTLSAAAGRATPLDVWVQDDGIGKRSEGRNRAGTPRPAEPTLGVVWSKFRGPGRVDFGAAEPPIGEDGKATTTATFSEAGEYVLRVLAWDSSGRPARGIMAGGFQCCWTNGYVRVTVR